MSNSLAFITSINAAKIRLLSELDKKDVETVCTPPPQNNEFKMITNYIVLAHVSFNATVRLKTR